ncbi:MAG: WD40/YVTN/BNR-like repeat-containing protein, partial [Bacteroidota bacterium]
MSRSKTFYARRFAYAFRSALTVSLFLVSSGFVYAQQWHALGPFTRPSLAVESDFSSKSANGVGRVGVIRFVGKGVDRKIFVCTPYDGLRISKVDTIDWKRPSMFGMPATGIADVVALDKFGRELLASTGDADCGLDPDYPAMNSESCQCRGLFTSVDGGENWTGPIGKWHDKDGKEIQDFWKYPTLKIARRILIPRGPRGPWFVVIHTRSVKDRSYKSWVFRSKDQGGKWYPVLESDDGWFKGISNHPERKNELYVTGRSVFMSCDAGESWIDIGKKGLPPDSLVDRCEIAFGPSPERCLFVMVNNRASKMNELFSIGRNHGSFQQLAAGAVSPPWRTAFSPEPSSANSFLFSAGNKVNRFESVNGTWRAVAVASGPHDDIHEIILDEETGYSYVAHDGGLHVTADGGSSWSDLTAGIDVSEPWGASMSVVLDRIRILCGTQDCGTVLYDADQDVLKGEWLIVRGGDGMKPFVSRTNPDSMIAVDGNNNLNHYSSDGGRKWITSRPVTGSRAEYLRPFVPDPWKPETLYTGYQDLYRSANGGKDWLPLKVPGTGTVAAIAVAASDSKVIYVAYSGPAWSEKISGKLFRSQDGGTTWMDISGGLRGA